MADLGWLQLYPTVDPEEVAAAVVEELKEDEWNLNELERLQQEQVPVADIPCSAV